MKCEGACQSVELGLRAVAADEDLDLLRRVELPVPPSPGLSLAGLLADPAERVAVARCWYDIGLGVWTAELHHLGPFRSADDARRRLGPGWRTRAELEEACAAAEPSF